MKRLAAVLLLAACTGCANGDAMGIRFEPEDSTPVTKRVRLPVPVKLGVRLQKSRYGGFHDLVLHGLRRTGSFSEIRVIYGRGQQAGLDYIADFDYSLETGSRWYNYFTIFPGFAVFACHWAHLRWDFDLTTKLRLRRADGTEVGRFVRHDEHEMAYTSPGYGIASDIGWFGFLFLPAVGSPFVTGFVAVFSGSGAVAYRRRFFVSASGSEWGERVANLVTTGIEGDLKSGRMGARPQPPKPIVLPAQPPKAPAEAPESSSKK